MKKTRQKSFEKFACYSGYSGNSVENGGFRQASERPGWGQQLRRGLDGAEMPELFVFANFIFKTRRGRGLFSGYCPIVKENAALPYQAYEHVLIKLDFVFPSLEIFDIYICV